MHVDDHTVLQGTVIRSWKVVGVEVAKGRIILTHKHEGSSGLVVDLAQDQLTQDHIYIAQERPVDITSAAYMYICSSNDLYQSRDDQ